MASLRTLQNRINTLVAATDRRSQVFPKAEVKAWLHDFVLEIDDLCRLPSFQEYAKWPLTHLTKGCKTPERRLVRKIEKDFLRLAAGLHRRLTKLKSDYNVPVYLLQTDTIKFIAERFWIDLVNPDDYFIPRQTFNRTQKTAFDKKVIEALNVFTNPFLRSIGDYITRTMRIRIELITELLKNELTEANYAHNLSPRKWWYIMEDYRAWMEEIELNTYKLNLMCFNGKEHALRNACIAVTQTYVAFHPKPHTGWLSLKNSLSRGTILSEQLIHNPDFGTLDQLCDAVNLTADYFGGSSGRQTEYEKKIETVPLVLRQDPPTAFWGGIKIDVAWESQRLPWKFLWEITLAARTGRAISEIDIYGDDDIGDTALDSHYSPGRSLQ
ncbi:MAG: hypothetical protein JNJ77_12755 [Planctomycetia bacterium]|nr:hypothetical protein [Planctomycetia bacterium]